MTAVSAANIPERAEASSRGMLSRRWKELASPCVNVFGAPGAEAHDVLHPKFRD